MKVTVGWWPDRMVHPFLTVTSDGVNSISDELPSDWIWEVCACVLRELAAQGLCRGGTDYLEAPAFEIQSRIENPEIRSMHIMEG